MQATHVLDFPNAGIRSPERAKMGKSPATRFDTWSQTVILASTMLGVLATIVVLFVTVEHRLTVIETNTSQQTKLAEGAAADGRDARDISRLSARGTLILLEIFHGTPAARSKRTEMEEVMSELKKRKISENDLPTDPQHAGGAFGALPRGASQ